MSNRLIQTTVGIGWSMSIDRPSVRRLHEQYAATCGHIDRGQLRLVFSRVGRFKNVFHEPLGDKYLHFIGGAFSAGVGASIAIAFPYFEDLDCKDGTMTDRLVSVHTMGDVSDEVIDERLDRITEEIGVLFPVTPPESEPLPHVWDGQQ